MPFLVSDWLSSTRIATMSPAQEGAFLRLLLHAWGDPDCTLPDDDDELAALSRLGSDWKRCGAKVKACFVSDQERPGRIYNQKQRSVRAQQDARIQAAKLHGKKAAEARWGKPQAMPEHSPSTAPAMPEHCPGNTSYSSPVSLTRDKALLSLSEPIKPTKPIKLTKPQKAIADRIEAALTSQWVNDAGKWIGRIRANASTCERLISEVESAAKESRINTTPAQYAEDTWQRFTGA